MVQRDESKPVAPFEIDTSRLKIGIVVVVAMELMAIRGAQALTLRAGDVVGTRQVFTSVGHNFSVEHVTGLFDIGLDPVDLFGDQGRLA